VVVKMVRGGDDDADPSESGCVDADPPDDADPSESGCDDADPPDDADPSESGCVDADPPASVVRQSVTW